MAENNPAVIADNIHVNYRVYASGRAVGNHGRGLIFNQTSKAGIRTIHAITGVSFIAHQNESIGIIGTNGSGKTTLMNTIAGLLTPTTGTIYATSQPNLLGVGASLMPNLSGAWNIILGCLAMGMTRDDIDNHYHNIIDFAELGDFIDLPMRTYSSGMTQRLKFAIATARPHDILIIDEALAVGDQQFRTKSEQRIRDIQEAAGTVFLVSHSMSTIRATCPRTLWLNRGLLIADGPTKDVVAAYEAHTKKTTTKK